MAITFGYRHPFTAASVNGICVAQTTSGASNLAINGSLAQTIYPNDGGTVSFFVDPRSPNAVFGGGYNVPITLTSAGNLSGVNFTITGTALNPYNPFTPVTETIAGPSANTVSTTALFNRVLSISSSAAVGSNVSAGTGSSGSYGNWLPVMGPGQSMPVSVSVAVTGTINYTVQQTYDDPYNSSIAPVAFNNSDTTLVGATTSQQGNYITPITATRVIINSGSGSLVFNVVSNGLTS